MKNIYVLLLGAVLLHNCYSQSIIIQKHGFETSDIKFFVLPEPNKKIELNFIDNSTNFDTCYLDTSVLKSNKDYYYLVIILKKFPIFLKQKKNNGYTYISLYYEEAISKDENTKIIMQAVCDCPIYDTYYRVYEDTKVKWRKYLKKKQKQYNMLYSGKDQKYW